MKTYLYILPFFLMALVALSSCGEDSSGGDGDDLDLTGLGSGADGDRTVRYGDDDDGLGSGSGEEVSVPEKNVDFVACETLSSNLESVSTRVMLLQDISSSMSDNNKWELAKVAIEGMVTAYDSEIEFGLDMFPRNANCTVGDTVIYDVALNNAEIINGNLTSTNLSRTTPLLLAMQNYAESAYAPTFLDGSGGSYLVIVSDGGDSCGTNGQGQATPAQLGAVTAELRDRFGIRTIVIGFGQGAEPNQLNAIAEAGGTAFSTYLKADDGAELQAALSQIAETVVASCEFQLGTFENPDVNYDWVVVSMDGKPLGRDDGCKKGAGWTFTSQAHTTIEFCSEACQSLESGDVDSIKVELACSADDVPPPIVE